MSDGLFTVPIVTNDGQITGWTRGVYLVIAAAHHKTIGTDLRFLRYADGVVYEISQEAKDAILAQDAANAQAAIDAAAQAAIDAAAQAAIDAAQAAIDAANAPFEVSKFKLCMEFQKVGKLSDFMAFINADAEITFLWHAASVLDSDNQMVLAALENVSSLLPDGCTAHDLLLQCKA